MSGIFHAAPSVIAAFLGSLVEFVEALTIALALGTVRGRRAALVGTAAEIVIRVAIVPPLGPLLRVVPLRPLQIRDRPAVAVVRYAMAARGDPARGRYHSAPILIIGCVAIPVVNVMRTMRKGAA